MQVRTQQGDEYSKGNTGMWCWNTEQEQEQEQEQELELGLRAHSAPKY